LRFGQLITKKILQYALAILMLPLAVMVLLYQFGKRTKEKYMDDSLFKCDTCQLPALSPTHMSFEWGDHGCGCRDGFRMVHNDEHSPFGDCHIRIQENHKKPKSIKRAPVEILGKPGDPRRKELFSYVRHNRPDLVAKSIVRWAELGVMVSEVAEEDEE
tara:strand:+ start:95 stop:571 length:477 start_codon:yes stop_codon:yes gene_type:complete